MPEAENDRCSGVEQCLGRRIDVALPAHRQVEQPHEGGDSEAEQPLHRLRSAPPIEQLHRTLLQALGAAAQAWALRPLRSAEHTSELQSQMRTPYAAFRLI